MAIFAQLRKTTCHAIYKFYRLDVYVFKSWQDDNDIENEFYFVEKGSVEILVTAPDGTKSILEV